MLLDQVVAVGCKNKTGWLGFEGIHPMVPHMPRLRQYCSGQERLWQAVVLQCGHDILILHPRPQGKASGLYESPISMDKLKYLRQHIVCAVDAWNFIFGEGEEDFIAVCGAADINPEALQEKIKAQPWYIGDDFFRVKAARIEEIRMNAHRVCRAASRKYMTGVITVNKWLEALDPPPPHIMKACGYDNALEELCYYGYLRALRYLDDGMARVTLWGSPNNDTGVIKNG